MLRWCWLTSLFNARFSVLQSQHNTLIRMQSHDRKKNAIKKNYQLEMFHTNVEYDECSLTSCWKKKMDRTTGKGAHIHNNKLKKLFITRCSTWLSHITVRILSILDAHFEIPCARYFFHINFFFLLHFTLMHHSRSDLTEVTLIEMKNYKFYHKNALFFLCSFELLFRFIPLLID